MGHYLLFLTDNCNRNCCFCSNKLLKNFTLSYDKAVQECVSAIDAGYSSFSITGGEPTIVPYLPQLIHFLKQKKRIVSLTTNGLRLSYNHYLKRILELDEIWISFHAVEPDIQEQMTGLRRNAFSAFDNLHHNNLSFKINTTITSINYRQLPLIVQALKSYPLAEINFSVFRPEKKVESRLDLLPLPDLFMPYLEESFRLLNTMRTKVTVSGIPLCLLGNKEHFHFDLKWLISERKIQGHDLVTQELSTHPECVRCSLKKICTGFFTWHEDYSIFYSKYIKASHKDPYEIIKKARQYVSRKSTSKCPIQ